jgi:nitrogen fixation NifU-like protein
MITSEIIKIAANTSNVGLTNKYNYKSTKKNVMCGDIIKIELIINKSKIISMKYEAESCIYCEASASLLAQIIKNLTVSVVKKELNKIKYSFTKNIDFIFSKKFLNFKSLINKNNKKRLNCILLPIEAVLKALK